MTTMTTKKKMTGNVIDGRQQMKLKRFFWYKGAKYSMAKLYPQPIYPTIIEPFAGSAGYSTLWNNRRIELSDDSTKVGAVWDFLINSRYEDIMTLPPAFRPSQLLSEQSMPQGAKYLIGFWLFGMTSTPLDRCPRTAWLERRKRHVWKETVRHCVASQTRYISHWKIGVNDYLDLPNTEATWFIDPPYCNNSITYEGRGVDYEVLAEWCRSRKGQVIVCEGPDASWLPFRHLTICGSSHQNSEKSIEYIWTQGC